MKTEILEKTNELINLLEEEDIENKEEMEEILAHFKEKLYEACYFAFLRKGQEIFEQDLNVFEIIELLNELLSDNEAFLEEYEEVSGKDIVSQLEETIDDLSYLEEGDVNAAKEIWDNWIEVLS